MAALPLHPRRAQHIVSELVQTRSDLTPEAAASSLPKRIQRSQERYLCAVYAAKRGASFELLTARRCIMLQLSRDGSTLDVLRAPNVAETDIAESNVAEIDFVEVNAVETDIVETIDASAKSLDMQRITSVQLADIVQIAVSDCTFTVRLRSSGAPSNQLERGDGTQSDAHSTLAFRAASAAELTAWVLVLTYGANAFQQQMAKKAATATDVVWQAARLRMFELADVLSLHEAVAVVTDSAQELVYSGSDGADAQQLDLFLTCQVREAVTATDVVLY